MLLSGFDPKPFLRDHWQKPPLLIRNPWANWQNPLAPNDLAGLACEAAIESRLIWRSGGRANGNLRCEHGPFEPARFTRLAKTQWTLLVQAVDHHVPVVAALMDAFRFIPNWRRDDIMVSYATDGGGVGAHFDQYDVFLIQGLGRRRWRVGQACDAASRLVPHDDLRLLADFAPIGEYVLEPGDMLYLPPGIAHEGAAMGDDCMTYSVGFRSAATGELIGDWADHLAAELPADHRYADPGLQLQDNPGAIAPAAIAALHAQVIAATGDAAGFARWFGTFATAPKYPDSDWRPAAASDAATMRRRLAGTALHRNPASRFAFIRQDEAIWLFVDGECIDCRDAAATFAEQICAQPAVTVGPPVLACDAALAVIVRLYNKGSVSFDPH